MSQVEPQQCVRHPERTTYLACTRCGRPSCPQCLTPAAVGFHCTDCVAAQPEVRGRTKLGARGTDGNPRVTKAIIGLCVTIFVLQISGYINQNNYSLWAPAVNAGEWWRIITAGFFHVNTLHIAFNMYALWLLGPNLEQLLGHRKFSALYLLSLLGGSTASYLFNPPITASVGASGAIFGLFGATVVIARRLGLDASGIYGIIGINLVIGFIIPGIDWRAHVGGLVAGALSAWVIARRS